MRYLSHIRSNHFAGLYATGPYFENRRPVVALKITVSNRRSTSWVYLWKLLHRLAGRENVWAEWAGQRSTKPFADRCLAIHFPPSQTSLAAVFLPHLSDLLNSSSRHWSWKKTTLLALVPHLTWAALSRAASSSQVKTLIRFFSTVHAARSV